MPRKLAKTSGKSGRPSKPRQAAIRRDCLEQYNLYTSAASAARTLDINPHTVEKYYREFEAKELEETNLQFIAKQRAIKKKVIGRLDDIILNLDAQFKTFVAKLAESDADEKYDTQKYELMKTSVMKIMSDILQQKASIEVTPTLDISLDNYIEEKYGKFIKEAASTNSATLR
jgi:hypothetical protein